MSFSAMYNWIWTINLIDISIVIFYLLSVSLIIYAFIKGIEYILDFYKRFKGR